MKKRYLYLLMLPLLLIVTLNTSCKGRKTTINSFTDRINKIDNYYIEGTLENYFPSGTKQSKITVYYTKPSYYRVEVNAAGKVEKQIIIKNDDGVSVLIPSLNKVFKVNSNWPNANSQPYLLSSLVNDILKDPNAEKKIDDLETTYKVKARVFGDNVETYQIITIDNKTGLPKQVTLFKDDNTKISTFTFNKIDSNTNVDKEKFKIDTTLTTLKEIYADELSNEERIITYPTYLPEGLKLKDEVNTGNKDNRKTMLTYSGTNYVTIYECFINPFETSKIEYITGDIYITSGSIGMFKQNSFIYLLDGIEYSIYSNDLDKIEIVYIGESLQRIKEK